MGGGLAILLGAFVPLITIPMILVLLVATFTVHAQSGFKSIKLVSVVNGAPRFGPPGYESDVLYIGGLLTLLFGGGGPFAVDSMPKAVLCSADRGDVERLIQRCMPEFIRL